MAEWKRKEETAETDMDRAEEQATIGRKGPETVNSGRPTLVRSEASQTDVPPSLRAQQGQDSRASGQLFSDPDIGELRARWSSVQTGFVDEPRRAVEEADKLVAAVMQRLTQGFANERSALEKQWDQGSNVSTEDLRIALQRYRTFFDRLLNA